MSKSSRVITSIVVPWTASATSGEVTIGGSAGGSIFIPTSFAAAATCTFLAEEVAAGAGDWSPVHLDGSILSLAVSPGAHNILPAQLFGFAKLKFVLNNVQTGNDEYSGST